MVMAAESHTLTLKIIIQKMWRTNQMQFRKFGNTGLKISALGILRMWCMRSQMPSKNQNTRAVKANNERAIMNYLKVFWIK